MALPSPLNRISTHARWLYPVGVFALAVVLGGIFGLGLALLIVAGGVLGGSIWFIWASLQGLGGDIPITLDEALSLGAPSAEEEQKRSVLRALKDLEYERAVGKINEEDYASLAEHYRSEAKRLLRAVDKDLNPERERAERILAERLAAVQAGGTPGGRRAAARAAAKVEADSDPAQSLPAADADPEEDTDESGAGKRPSSDTAL